MSLDARGVAHAVKRGCFGRARYQCSAAHHSCATCKFVFPISAESVSVFFRFGAALALVVAIALAGTAMETQNLAYKRQLSQQQYRLEVLVETQAGLKLEAQRLGTPAKLFDALQKDGATLHRPAKPQRHDERRTPLLNWNHSAGPRPD